MDTNEVEESPAERRQLTVMFCDLVGSTALSARLDPEDLREVIAAYHDCVAEVVGRHDGFVAQYLGDGALVYFGYPRAHEDDAERAVGTGLAMIEAIRRLDTAAGRLQIRIGVATGLVVVGDLKRADRTARQSAVGQAPNLAARLQAFAEPDMLVIDSATLRLTGGLFEYHDLGSLIVSGFSAPVHAWGVLGKSAVASRFEALRTRIAPLVGREKELELLSRRWDEARSGRGRVILLVGEPGIGKSRLAVALADGLKTEPHLQLSCFCSPRHANSPLYPVVVELEHAAMFERGDSADARSDKLAQLFAAPTCASSEELVLLAELLSLPTGGRRPPPDLTPQRKREKTLQVLLRRVRQLSRHQPLLIVFEDVHWIDPTTRELLDLMVAEVAHLPILLLITCRPEFHPPWLEQGHLTMSVLDRLHREAGAALIEEVAGGRRLAEGAAAEILDRADGIPLFVEELTKAVLESDASHLGPSAVPSGNPARSPTIPISLHASLVSRLDRLGRNAKTVAQIAAVIGREFSHELVVACAGMEFAALETGLARLNEAGLVFRRGLPPDDIYTFKHALVQDVAYGTLLRGRRQALHARIARALQERLPEIAEAHPELLAHHFAEAGMPKEAIAHWRSAGDRSLARSATAEAVLQFQAALRLLDGMPDDPAETTLRIDLYLRLGDAMRAAKGTASTETGEAYHAANDLCIAAGDSKRRLQALNGLVLSHMNRGDLRIAHGLATDLQTFGREAADQGALLRGHELRGMAAFCLGSFDEARRELEAVTSTADPARGKSAASTEPAHTFVYLAWTLFMLGSPSAARERQAEGLAAAAMAPPLVAGFTLCNACYIDQIEANWAAVKERADATIALAREKGIPLLDSFGKVFLGWSLAEAGHAPEGLALIGDFLAASDKRQHRLELPYLFAVVAQAQKRAGRTDIALEIVDRSLAMIEETGEGWFAAELHRLRGEFLSRLDASGAIRAEESFHRALELARGQGARMWELRAAASLGRLWRRQGWKEQGRTLLASVVDSFAEAAEGKDLREARALLAELA